jgi:hypothetical protein
MVVILNNNKEINMTQDDLELMLGKDEKVAEQIKEYLRKHLADLSKDTGMSKGELDDYIERIMVA